MHSPLLPNKIFSYFLLFLCLLFIHCDNTTPEPNPKENIPPVNVGPIKSNLAEKKNENATPDVSANTFMIFQNSKEEIPFEDYQAYLWKYMKLTRFSEYLTDCLILKELDTQLTGDYPYL